MNKLQPSTYKTISTCEIPIQQILNINWEAYYWVYVYKTGSTRLFEGFTCFYTLKVVLQIPCTISSVYKRLPAKERCHLSLHFLAELSCPDYEIKSSVQQKLHHMDPGDFWRLMFIRPSLYGTYYDMVLSARPSVCPSVVPVVST